MKRTVCSDSRNEQTREFGDPSICNTDDCEKYLGIWQNLLMERNNLSQAFFDDHIRVHESSINDWRDGTSFRVCYWIQIDWAISYECDKFIINIDPDDTKYPSLDLPRGVALNEQEVKLAAYNRAFGSTLSKINGATQIAYLSEAAALNELVSYSELDTLCYSGVSLDQKDGNLVLQASAEYRNQENPCVFGSIDLVSGQKEINDSPCRLID
ncbi:MAG: hypothetical protein AAF927_14235 [Bacteroidota bacterium]